MIYNPEKRRDIAYEPSSKRRFYRLTNPIKVIIDGKDYKTVNWSVEAFEIKDYSGELTEGNETLAIFEINFQDFAVKFEQKVKILRIEPKDKKLVAEYIDESRRSRKILSCFSRGIVTGEFQSFEEIIRHIDAPINDNYIQETFQENHKTQNKSFSRQFSVFFYTILGITAVLYIFNIFYLNVHKLYVDSAFVTGKTEIIHSPSKGILTEIYVKEDSVIDKGKPLFQVSSPEMQKEIEEKKIEILKNKALLREKQKQLVNLRSKLENYKKDFSFKLKVQEKVIESVGEKIDLLKAELEKKIQLYERKLVCKPEIDALKKELLQQEQELASANYEYYHIYQNIKDPESGINHEINKREDSKNLNAEIEKIKEIINIDERELSYIETLSGQNTIKAPFKAILSEVLAFEGKNVNEKTPVMLLKYVSGEKLVEAYLTEKEALKLKLGLTVKINVPSQNINLKGKLVKLERIQEFQGKNLIVAVIKPETPGLLKDIDFGTPVGVVFIKKKFLKPRYTYDG